MTTARQKTLGGIPWPQVLSAQAHRYWYSIRDIATADIVCNRFFDKRFFFGITEGPVVEDQTLYGIILSDELKVLRTVQAALLNSSISYLLVELSGRVALGQGVLQYAVYEMGRLAVIDARTIDPSVQGDLEASFISLAKRPILPIFDEVNQDDRRAFDSILFELLGLTTSEVEAVYGGVVELVHQRLSKANSV